ncbi:MAG: type II toxin-antitoxin system Phd/YefM family antitoxin [Clostridiales bacterium]|jgi:PHD/YefM family antitoxin component YafN of YafNO toxin-antitoxin module|nr:type II toxin-antitoxin system Phd/YefM family antitoxin [Clostridiales bacterium]
MKEGYMEVIRPSADLRKNYPEMSRLCRENRTPIAVTVNGRADTVLMSHQQYREMCAEMEFYARLAQAEEDIRLGRVSGAEEVFVRLERDLREAAK